MSRTNESARTIKEIAYDANLNAEYIGEASPGAATSSAVWRIKKLTYDADENITKIQWANKESTQFTQVWDDRASLTYS